MSKDNIELKDVIHYYLGAECVTIAPDGIEHQIRERVNYYWLERSNRDGTILKPILRKLDSMTEEEKKEAEIIVDGPLLTTHFTTMIYLLKNGFDLFNLIENNLAIDKNATP